MLNQKSGRFREEYMMNHTCKIFCTVPYHQTYTHHCTSWGTLYGQVRLCLNIEWTFTHTNSRNLSKVTFPKEVAAVGDSVTVFTTPNLASLQSLFGSIPRSNRNSIRPETYSFKINSVHACVHWISIQFTDKFRSNIGIKCHWILNILKKYKCCKYLINPSNPYTWSADYPYTWGADYPYTWGADYPYKWGADNTYTCGADYPYTWGPDNPYMCGADYPYTWGADNTYTGGADNTYTWGADNTYMCGADYPYTWGADYPYMCGADYPYTWGADYPYTWGADNPYMCGADNHCTALFLLLVYTGDLATKSLCLVSASSVSSHVPPSFCTTYFLTCHPHIYLLCFFLNFSFMFETCFGTFILKTCPYHLILLFIHLSSKALIFKFYFCLTVNSYINGTWQNFHDIIDPDISYVTSE
jgi:hypothetical protein